MKLSPLFAALTFLSATLSTVNANELAQIPLTETTNLVKAGNKFITLLGTQIETGDLAPNFKVVNDGFTPVNLSDFENKTILISAVPSLDTGVCSLQTKRFNEEVENLSDDIIILTISNDLPFAQKRFCKVEEIDKIKVLSDSVWRDFGHKYGLLIKDMGLLTRAIFVIDTQGRVAYKELVENISSHPDYEKALSTLKSLSPKRAEENQESKPDEDNVTTDDNKKTEENK